MHVIIVTLKVKPEFAKDFEAEMKRHQGWVKANEPGCVMFEVSTDKKEPSTYHLYEIYKDDKAMADHIASPSLKQMGAKMPGWVAERARSDATRWE